MNAQELENNADIRIKLASINNAGGYDYDAAEEYKELFPADSGDLAEGWRYEDVGTVQTRFERERSAWQLTHSSVDYSVAAVEHESGIELLVLEVASGVGSAAVVGLSKWLWQKWREARGAGKLASSFVAEKVVERDAQGGVRRVERVELRGPVDAAAVNAAIDRLMTSG